MMGLIKTIFLGIFLAFGSFCNGIEYHALSQALQGLPSFWYPLDVQILPGSDEKEVLVCCHGYGSNSSLANIIASYKPTKGHIVGFNFPDYKIQERGFDFSKVCYGTPYELLPALCLLKAIVVTGGADRVSLYGFSAGGGAVVNIVAALNTDRFDHLLGSWGISQSDKEKILASLQKGVILLDAPLKSTEEIKDAFERDQDFDLLTLNYRNNHMRPIDALSGFQGASLSVVLFFQNPDAILSNRDDKLFADRLLQYNATGRNQILNGDEGGHCGWHFSLWKAYQNFLTHLTQKEQNGGTRDFEESNDSKSAAIFY